MIGSFHDGNLQDLLESRFIGDRRSKNHSVQMHSSLIQTSSGERTGDQCVELSWAYSGNIFCTKIIPETSDELVASGAGDAEVRIFNLSRLSGVVADGNAITPSALFQCHKRRVEDGNPNVIWSASEDGTLRQHDLREGNLCPSARSSQQECRNVLMTFLKPQSLCSSVPPPFVNCVQCHPFDCVVVTSGIGNTKMIWTPTAPAPSMVTVPDGHCICVDDAIDGNQRRLTSNWEIILPFYSGEIQNARASRRKPAPFRMRAKLKQGHSSA